MSMAITIKQRINDEHTQLLLPDGTDLAAEVYAIDLRLRPDMPPRADLSVCVGELEIGAVAEFVTEVAGKRYRLVEVEPLIPPEAPEVSPQTPGGT